MLVLASLLMLGAALFTDWSIRFGGLAIEGAVRDPARIAAQIITGIGFLGAGTIIQARGTVTGLTTAATLWVVAGIGMSVGSGSYVEVVGSNAGSTDVNRCDIQRYVKLLRLLGGRGLYVGLYVEHGSPGPTGGLHPNVDASASSADLAAHQGRNRRPRGRSQGAVIEGGGGRARSGGCCWLRHASTPFR